MKDGKDGGEDVYAYNGGYGNSPTMTFHPDSTYGEEYDWALVPDTQTAPVPEPGTMFLLGVGLLGIAGITRKGYRRMNS